LYEAIPHARKTIKVYPDVRHEPHNDYGHEQVVGHITEWLSQLASPVT
jgi:alpha-beta hydrolase superfamily lysophospholipase